MCTLLVLLQFFSFFKMYGKTLCVFSLGDVGGFFFPSSRGSLIGKWLKDEQKPCQKRPSRLDFSILYSETITHTNI